MTKLWLLLRREIMTRSETRRHSIPHCLYINRSLPVSPPLSDKLKEKRKLRRIFRVFQVNSISEYKIISHLERESCCWLNQCKHKGFLSLITNYFQRFIALIIFNYQQIKNLDWMHQQNNRDMSQWFIEIPDIFRGISLSFKWPKN